MAHKLTVTLLLLLAVIIYPGVQSGQVSLPVSIGNNLENRTSELYEAIQDTTLNPHAFLLAMQGYTMLASKGCVTKSNLITIIDYSRPSNDKRFYVIDLFTKKIQLKTLVAHGRNSGELYASHFSNKLQSHQSALGFYLTGNPYHGGQGYSLQMNGLDTGYNDNARKRAIVIHGADYVDGSYIVQYGRIGRSFGCPALPRDLNAAVIDLICGGSVVFCYYPDENYLNGSRILTHMLKKEINADRL